MSLLNISQFSYLCFSLLVVFHLCVNFPPVFATLDPLPSIVRFVFVLPFGYQQYKMCISHNVIIAPNNQTMYMDHKREFNWLYIVHTSYQSLRILPLTVPALLLCFALIREIFSIFHSTIQTSNLWYFTFLICYHVLRLFTDRKFPFNVSFDKKALVECRDLIPGRIYSILSINLNMSKNSNKITLEIIFDCNTHVEIRKTNDLILKKCSSLKIPKIWHNKRTLFVAGKKKQFGLSIENSPEDARNIDRLR